MGFLGPIPASKLGAFYDPKTQTLTLSAEGTVMEATYGYRFTRLPWMSGLKYRLEGWTGPLTGQSAPYSFSEKFNVSIYPFPKDVIIVDAGHSNGVPVEVHFGGLGDSVVNLYAAAAIPSTTAEKDVSEIAAPGQQTINTLFREPFTITHAAGVPQFGSINIDFDKRYLDLDDAKIDNNNIVWKFNSLETGNTQVILTVSGGIATFVMRIVYDVRIFVLNDILEPGPVIINNESPGLILSYLGRVNIARRLVQDKYPDAVLYNAEASTADRKGAATPNLLGHMQVMFRSQKGTITINSTGYGTLVPPHLERDLL